MDQSAKQAQFKTKEIVIIRHNNKIRDLEDLAKALALLRTENKKIVHCHGVFDLLHIGHIRYLEHARELGDVLAITVTPDRYVNKGPHRPVFNEDLRTEAMATLDCVDYVAINKWPTAVETIKLLQPDFYVKGSKYTEAEKDCIEDIELEEAAIKSVSGEFALTDDITFSSSNLINRHLPVFSKAVNNYLVDFSTRYSTEDVLRYLKNMQSLKVLVVGETIIDEYQYCESMGKSAKEPILAMRYISTEKFAGGILAVVNHVSNFCDNVGFITILGAKETQEDFVLDNVNSNVKMMYLYKADSPTIVKRRFVESYLVQKLFEVYEMNDVMLNQTQNQELCAMLDETIPQYDVVIVADFGHGMLSNEAIEIICNKARFLVVNTQANAGNKGFNTISKYPQADHISLAEGEIRLEAKDRHCELQETIIDISKRLACGRVIITRGKNGCLCYSEEEGFFEVPAFAGQVIDRIGAGDAFLSLTALCLAQNAPMEVVGFIGNAVGAQAVATVGNREPIKRVPLFNHIKSLLR